MRNCLIRTELKCYKSIPSIFNLRIAGRETRPLQFKQKWVQNNYALRITHYALNQFRIPNSEFRIKTKVLCLNEANTGHYRSIFHKHTDRRHLFACNNADDVYDKRHNKQYDNNDLGELAQSLLSCCTAGLVKEV